MRNGDADRIASLIEPGRVYRGVYTDPGLFELEMERVFGRAWLYVGHASQVPQAVPI
jgi:benzoate/toluate 1,2-dioxygenase subunit alpha